MDSINLETNYIKTEISRCESLDELKCRIFPMIQSQREQWKCKINEIIRENHYTKSRFAELCGVSRVTVDKWCKGAIPKNRETFLRIGMAAGYNLETMNRFIQRYGRYPALYSKSLEDCVCIFVLSHDFGAEAVRQYDYILSKIKENLIRDENAEQENISTEKFDEKLSEVEDEDALKRFIEENVSIFSYAYHNFYAYVKVFIDNNYQRFSSSICDMAEAQEWSSSLRQCVSAIRQNKWYPTRNKIISLGLHLSMSHNEIDKLLNLAHMEALCAKNLFESVIMFILDDASLKNMLDQEAEQYDPDELCRYARKILGELDIPEVKNFISELPELEDGV